MLRGEWAYNARPPRKRIFYTKCLLKNGIFVMSAARANEMTMAVAAVAGTARTGLKAKALKPAFANTSSTMTCTR